MEPHRVKGWLWGEWATVARRVLQTNVHGQIRGHYTPNWGEQHLWNGGDTANPERKRRATVSAPHFGIHRAFETQVSGGAGAKIGRGRRFIRLIRHSGQ